MRNFTRFQHPVGKGQTRKIYMANYSDHQLLSMFQSGDPLEMEKALEFLYLLEGGVIKKNIIRRICNKNGTQSDGEDVCHEAFIIARNNFIEGKFRGECPMKNYIVKVAEWQWLNMRRKRKPDLGLDLELTKVVEKSVEESLLRQEKFELFDKAIALLSEKCREALRLRREGFQIKKIALLLYEDQEKVAENNVYRCQKKLREILKKLQ